MSRKTQRGRTSSEPGRKVDTMPKANVVAVINTSPDVVDLMRISLERAGFVVVSALTFEIRDGAVDLEAFVAQHHPKVIVYDIAPPYDANWALFKHMKQMAFMRGRYFVLSSTNRRQVERIAGPDHQIYEIVGRPLDLDQLVEGVRQAMKARPTKR